MKKSIQILFLCLLAMSLMMIGCGGKYSDVKKVTEKYIDLSEDYVADIDKADDAKAIAKAMNRFADGMEELWPEMKKISEKYPELKDKNNQPEELKEVRKRAEEVSQRMAKGMMKVFPYIKDPEVQKAQQRLGAIMSQK